MWPDELEAVISDRANQQCSNGAVNRWTKQGFRTVSSCPPIVFHVLSLCNLLWLFVHNFSLDVDKCCVSKSWSVFKIGSFMIGRVCEVWTHLTWFSSERMLCAPVLLCMQICLYCLPAIVEATSLLSAMNSNQGRNASTIARRKKNTVSFWHGKTGGAEHQAVELEGKGVQLQHRDLYSKSCHNLVARWH